MSEEPTINCDLLPCPHCGAPAVKRIYAMPQARIHYACSRGECHWTYLQKEEPMARAAWNRRSLDERTAFRQRAAAVAAPTGTEAAVCRDIAGRQQVGIKKYGTTVADNPLPLRDWLQHAYEECLDQAVYLKRAIAELDNGDTVSTS